MHKKTKLKTILCISMLVIATAFIYLQMTNSKIKVSKKSIHAEGERVAIEAKSTKDYNVKLYQKTEEENEFTEVKAKEEQGILSTTNTFEIETKDTTCPNNVTNIKTVIADDYIIISFDPAIDNATLYEYYIETEEKTNDINANNGEGMQVNKSNITQIYSDSGIKGYNYIIDNNKETEAGFDVNKTNDEPILFTGIQWDKDYYLHIRAIDNSGNFSNNITYKIDLPSKGVMLKYIDLNTNSEISPEETIIGNINENYDISSFNKNISGFKLVGIDGEMQGVLKKERINVKYNYAKNANMKIRYVDFSGKEILEPTIIEGYEGKEYSIYPKEISGYVCEVQNLRGKMIAGDDERVFTYNKLGNVTASYVNEITGENIADSIVITDIYGNTYKTEEKSILGYELSKVEGETEGTINSGNTNVTYYYKKQVSMVVKHVDMETNKLLDEEVISGLEGDKIEVESKDFDGYVLSTAKEKDSINNKDDLIKDALESYKSDEEKLEEEEIHYDYNEDEYYSEDDVNNEQENQSLSNISKLTEENLQEDLSEEKTNIVEEIISDDYDEDDEVTEDETNSKLEEYNIKQHYDIVLDPNEKEYIIYYKKK